MFLCLPLKFRQASIPTSSDGNESGEKPAPSYRSALSGSGAGSAAVLSRLRALLSENKLDAYVIPNEDEHGSEIPAASELRRGFMTGFHGTAGLAVVTQTEALLFVDSRYWIAAEKAMDPSLWKLRKVDPRAMVEGGFQDYLCNVGLQFPLELPMVLTNRAVTRRKSYWRRRSIDTSCSEGLTRCWASRRFKIGVPTRQSCR